MVEEMTSKFLPSKNQKLYALAQKNLQNDRL